MKDDIIKYREELVALSSDPIKTRELLDKLTEEEIEQYRIESTVHISKKDIEEEKDFEFYKVCKTQNGYAIHYKGGYTVVVDEKLLSTCSALDLLMADDQGENIDLAKSAVEMCFRIPMFVFSNEVTTYTIAEAATRYMIYLQDRSEVPTEETENPEYDKFIQQMNELMENFAAGLEKEGLEYERRNGITHDEEEAQTDGESEGQGEGQAEA